MVIALLLTTLIFALGILATSEVKTLMRIAIAGSIITAVCAAVIGVPAILAMPHADALWYIDPMAGLLVLLIGIIQLTAQCASIPYLKHELREGLITSKQVKQYYCLVPLFVLAMMVAVISNNLGVTWVALEATTLTTVLLVGLYTKKASLEAAWKYLLVCSVGITLALTGVVLVYYAATSGNSAIVANALTWSTLHGIARGLSPQIMKLAFIFILVGFGTKVGLFPMHTWLPDAHSKAPSPVSGMLSGLLLNVALLGIIRYKSLVDASLGSADWTNHLCIAFGALTFIAAACFIVVQKNYKRMLAYSSIEHMGFTTLAMGLGPVGMVAAVIHMVGHSLTKSMLFFGAGNILTQWKSTEISGVSQVFRYAPYTAVLFLIGIFSILGLPPSPLFASEYIAIGVAITAHPYITLAILAAGVVIFASMFDKTITMLFGKSNASDIVIPTRERWNISHTVMVVHGVLLVAIGVMVFTPQALQVISKLVSYLL